jgi:riboflavin synthase
MFTGLIEATGFVEAVRPVASGREFVLATPLAAELADGDSIAVNGVCLTVTGHTQTTFGATISPETLRVTTLGEIGPGARVNLERPLRHDGRVGGHFVLGHVDGVGRIRALDQDGDCFWLVIDIPQGLTPYVIPKGSIAVDGISLTIATLEEQRIRIQIVPYTWEHTALRELGPGAGVNIETDVIGKYVASLMKRTEVGA